MKKKYANDDITIVWKPDLCIHSTKCWRGLIEVFNPQKRPWINPFGASTERIIAQIKECPSGALSYYENNKKEDAMSTEETKNGENQVSVEVTKNGPLLITGVFTETDINGKETQKEGVTAYCRCGASKHKPYCDGTHAAIKFEG